jgi:hypothetical protein
MCTNPSNPYHVFNKDQTVRPAAIVENKRLRHALSIVKAKQDQKIDVKVLTNSEKVGYKKRPPAGAIERSTCLPRGDAL